METLLQDLKFALRSFRRAPAFPLAAITTLALGIGATTAIFSTLNAVLLKPLPYPQAEDLYNIRTTLTDGRVTTGMLSNGEISRLNGTTTTIVRAAGFQPNDLTLLHADGTPQHVKVYGVSDGFFEVFGLPMTLGGFKSEHFVPPPPPPRPRRRAGAAGSAAEPACRRHLASGVAAAVQWRPGDRRQTDPVRRGRDLDRRRRAARLRHAAWRRLLVRAAPRQGRHQPFLRRLHAPETGLDARTRQRRDGADHGAARPRIPRVRHESRLRDQVTRRVGRRRPGADPDHRDVGDRTPASAGLRQRCQPAAGTRRRPRARDLGPRRDRRAAEPHRPPVAHRVGPAVHIRRDSRTCAGVRRCPRAARAGRLEAAAARRRRLRWTGSGVLVDRAGGQRAAGRLRPGAAAGRYRRAIADEREYAVRHRGPRHGALAECDDGHRDRPGDRAGGRRRMAGPRLREPQERRTRVHAGQPRHFRRDVPWAEVSQSQRRLHRVANHARAYLRPAGRHGGRHDIKLPIQEQPRGVADRQAPRRAARRRASDRHAAARCQRRLLPGLGHAPPAGPRLRPRRSAGDTSRSCSSTRPS